MENQENLKPEETTTSIIEQRLKKIKKQIKQLKREQDALRVIKDRPELLNGELEPLVIALIKS